MATTTSSEAPGAARVAGAVLCVVGAVVLCAWAGLAAWGLTAEYSAALTVSALIPIALVAGLLVVALVLVAVRLLHHRRHRRTAALVALGVTVVAVAVGGFAGDAAHERRTSAAGAERLVEASADTGTILR